MFTRIDLRLPTRQLTHSNDIIHCPLDAEVHLRPIAAGIMEIMEISDISFCGIGTSYQSPVLYGNPILDKTTARTTYVYQCTSNAITFYYQGIKNSYKQVWQHRICPIFHLKHKAGLFCYTGSLFLLYM